MLNARSEKPSIEAWVMLNYALQSRAQVFAGSENESVRIAAQRLAALQQAVAANITQECAARNQ
jgi:prolyl-tRNA editing enzyme YbaK/EbsC (Cys-tRNA(Pro) deacylase)